MAYWIFKYTVLLFLRALYRPEIRGRENLPRGPVIIAGNHLSFSDSFFLGAVVNRRLTFLAKSSYFTQPGLRGRLMAWFFRSLGQVPTDRSGGIAGDAALSAGEHVLRRGGILCIYPEGTRSPDGRLYRGRTGVARLALASGVPVVPVAMIGTEVLQPPGRIIPRLGPVTIVIGTPLLFGQRLQEQQTGRLRRAVTDEIMSELGKCSGQDYVNRQSPGPTLPQRRRT